MDEEVKIIYETADFLVINKPAGWVTSNEGRNEKNKTVESWIKEKYPESGNLARHGIVHRLDKGTSGLVVIAKTEKAWLNLKNQFKKRLVKKQYWALAGGDLPQKGEIDMPVGRSKYGFSKFRVEWNGKRAITNFSLIKKIKIDSKIYSLVEIDLKTGRTHQIRVHLRYLGWPIAGDQLYGGNKILGLDRQFLHAKKLMLTDPATDKQLNFEIELASDLAKIIKTYGNN